MPRFDQSFSGLREQNLQDTLHLKQRFLDAKAKRVSKAKDKKQDAIQSSVHVQQKFLKRSADDLDSGGPLDSFEPPVKLQCTTQQHGSHQNEGLTKFSVEIVQQLEFTTSAASSQPQQISTNVTVKTHANASVKSDVSSPKASTPGTPGHTQKANIGLDVGTLVECVKQEPDNDFADLDQCAAALEKDAAANGGAGFGPFPDLIGDDPNDEIMSPAALNDLISDISSYPDYPDLMKDFVLEDKPGDNVNTLKAEDIKDPSVQANNELKHTQSPLLGHQNTYSPVFEKNSGATVNTRLPYSNMDFTKTELSPAAQTLKQMAEQHQHKVGQNQMGLNFNPGNRVTNSRSPYSDFQFQGDYGSPNSNTGFHKNNTGYPQPDMIKQEMIFQGGDFNDIKRKGPSASGMYTKQQQYSPYGSPGQSGSPGYLNSGRGSGPPPNAGPFGGGTPPRPPSGSGGNAQGPGGTSVQINQAQQLNISQQSHGHIQVSAGQQLHLSADIKGNVSIATQQGMHFTQQHGASSGAQNPQGGGNAQSSPMSSGQHQGGPMGGNVNAQSPLNQTAAQQMAGNMNSLGQQMGGQQGLGGMQNPGGAMGGQGGMQGGPGGMQGGPGGMQGGLGGIMGGPNMSHGSVLGGHGDTYSMSQSQTINFTQQTLRRATGPTGMGGPMGAPGSGPMGAAPGTLGPRLMSAQTLEQQKLQQMLRAQQAMQQQQQLRPPPPDYKASAGLAQGMQPRYGAPAPPPNIRRMPHQPIPPSGPMIRSNVYMLQQQQQQLAGRTIYNRQPSPMSSMDTIQQNSAEWRHLLMSQQQNANFGSMRPSFQQGGFNMNMGGSSLQQMTALQHQQQQLRAQQASMGGNQGGMGQMMSGQAGPMAQMNSMNQAMLQHMQQQQTLMQQQNSQMSMSGIHMQQSQSISINNQSLQQQQQPGNMIGASSNANNANNTLATFNPQTADFNFEFLDNLTGNADTAAFTDQDLLNSFGADAGFPLDF